jgi:type I restriction enzyme S subunit
VSTFVRRRFGDFLRPNLRPHTLGANEDADLVGMRWYGLGPFFREHKAALAIGKKSHFNIEAGDVIFNKLFAWKGTFGVVPPELHGMFVSDKFPTYRLDREKIDERYLEWYFRYPPLWDEARTLSTGSAAVSKLTLNPPKFLDLTIPAPSVADQRKIAGKLDAIEKRVIEAQRLRHEAQDGIAALVQSSLAAIGAKVGTLGTLEEVITSKPRNGWSASCDNSPEGMPVLALSAVTGFRYRADAFKRTSLPVDPRAHYWLREGDLLITRSNTPDLVGHAAIYSGSPTPCIFPDLIMRVPVDRERASTRFVWYWLQTPVVRDFIKKSAKGTSPTMKKISQDIVCNIPFPTQLSVARQESIVVELDQMSTIVDAIRSQQDHVGSLVESIMPASLHSAFGVMDLS